MSLDGLGVTANTAGQPTAAQLQEALTSVLKTYAAATGGVVSSSFGMGTSGTTGASSTDPDLPVLDAPVTTSGGFSGLSLESLVTAIGNTERKQACAEGVDRLEKRGEKIAENNELKLKEMADNLETMKKQEKLGGFMKAFQWIGAVLGALASAVTIAVGVCTGNPLLIAGGVVGMVMAVDCMVNVATDGKASMAVGIAKLAELCGASEETAQWIGLGFQVAMTLVAVGLSFGGAAGSLASAGTTATTTTLSMINKAQAGLQIISGFNTAAIGSANIAGAVFDYDVAMNQADLVELQAILEQIKMAQEFEEAMIQAEMERSNSLLSSVNDIIDESNSTAMAIMSGAPQMA